VIIEGKVVAESTGQPVNGVHVFIVDGEEEALTNNKGEFRIRSWQKSPFRITAEKYDRYRKESIVVTDASQKHIIRLKNN
jgi:acyl-coenzyme A synthetase/AMP-(fatty) acid ligase